MKRFLLLLFMAYYSTNITAQILSELSTSTLIQQSETFIKLSQQEDLATAHPQQLDSFRLSYLDEENSLFISKKANITLKS